MAALQVPPGRMGRVWLLNRIELAERGVTLLEHKLLLLTALRDELRETAAQTCHDWRDACREADRWGLRTALLGGQSGMDLAVPEAGASVTVEWTSTAGVRYPDTAACTLPPQDDPTVIHTSSASVHAARAYRAAVTAAAQHAVAQAALVTVEREVDATRLRARALSRHWLPLLRQELARIELELEEQDRDTVVRVRLVDRGPA